MCILAVGSSSSLITMKWTTFELLRQMLILRNNLFKDVLWDGSVALLSAGRMRLPGTTYVTAALHIEDDIHTLLKDILLIDNMDQDDIVEEDSTQQQMADVDMVGKVEKHGVSLAE